MGAGLLLEFQLLIAFILLDLIVLVGLNDLRRNRKLIVVRLDIRTMTGLAHGILIRFTSTIVILVTKSILARTLIQGVRGLCVLSRILGGNIRTAVRVAR